MAEFEVPVWNVYPGQAPFVLSDFDFYCLPAKSGCLPIN